jgi:hypothetical protein
MNDYDWAVRYVKGRIKKMTHIVAEYEFTIPGKTIAAIKEIESGNADKLILEAEVSAEMFGALQSVIAYSVERGAVLPVPLQIWGAKVLRGQAVRPKGPRSSTTVGTTGVERAIWSLTETIVEKTNLRKSKNPYGKNPCAFDAVAQAFREMGMTPSSYNRVRDHYYAEERRIKKIFQ